MSAERQGEVLDPAREEDMYETFRKWALQNYGDSGKTKTVTRKKYKRIVRILTGEEPSSAENSKFRFWVKAKGFRLGCDFDGVANGGNFENTLYVPVRFQVSQFYLYLPTFVSSVMSIAILIILV